MQPLVKKLCLLGLAGSLTAPAWAQAQDLESEVQSLMEENRRLAERLRQVEEELVTNRAPVSEEAEDTSLLQETKRRLDISGLLEVEAFARSGFDQDESDLTLATAALDVHAALNDWAAAHLLLLWEEDATEPVEVDEAAISLADPERWPLSLNAGKIYVPFGLYASYMVQDPLTLELGETNASALQLGLEHAGFYGSLYAFNGDIEEAGSEDTIDNFGASVGYVGEWDGFGLNVGVDYINNLAEADATVDALDKESIQDYVGGVGAHLHLSSGPFTFYSEYIAALDQFAPGELEFEGLGAEPRAWHLEAAYTRTLLGKVATLAVSYQGTAEAVDLGLPETRYLAAVNVALTDSLFWTLEYAHDKDYSLEENGTGGDADMVTTQLSLEF